MLREQLVIGNELELPNAVGVLSDGSLVVADAGNNRLCKFTQDGECVRTVGELGFGKYRLKEPVALSISPQDEVFVADWHNHRIVVYSADLTYRTEFGYYRDFLRDGIRNQLKSLVKFYYKLSTSGTYTRYFHSNGARDDERHTSPGTRVKLFLQGIYYWTFVRNDSVIDSINRVRVGKESFMKPNGIAFGADGVYVTQKNARCISIYERTSESDFRLREHIHSPRSRAEFGRLGNVHASPFSDCLYVCDEREGTIWKLDSRAQYVDRITTQDLRRDEFLPFSCYEFEERMLAVCSGTDILIIDLENKAVVSERAAGELHGMTFDPERNRLYVAQRSEDNIVAYTVN
jgi:sugar lactone lactonase YvrE